MKKTETLFPRISLVLLSAWVLPGAIQAQGDFQTLWQLGIQNGSQAEFSQETTAQPPPGSPTDKDDDYYFAGDYGGDIGNVAEDEDTLNFDRALTQGDPENRIHFIVGDGQLQPTDLIRVSFDMIGNNGTPIPFTVAWNDIDVLSTEVPTDANQSFAAIFTAGQVNAVPGQNTLRFTRDGAGGWIQFDYIRVEYRESSNLVLNFFDASATQLAFGESTTLSWNVKPGATVTLSPDVGDVTTQTINGVGSMTVTPNQSTEYTLTATADGVTETATVSIQMPLFGSFTGDPLVLQAGESTFLSWDVHPSASLTLEPGIGNVDGLTTDGIGSTEVSPTETTTYTLTATLGSQVETRQVSVVFNAGFALLWQLGEDNNTNTEFSQETTPQPAPGSPTEKDDDYYFAGDYGDPIGVVPEDEISTNFDRALTSGDPENRIHFFLDPDQARPGNQFNLIIDTFGNSAVVPFTASWNGNEIFAGETVGDPVQFVTSFTGADAGVVEGSNTLTLLRGGSGGWVQFDYIRVEIDIVSASGLIESFATSRRVVPSGSAVTLSWETDPDASLTISGVGDVSGNTVNGIGSVDVTPSETTTYVLTATKNGVTEEASVKVTVLLLQSFFADDEVIQPGKSTTLNWQVAPGSTVSIEPGIGDVTGQTQNGSGSIVVRPEITTEYVISVSRDGQTEVNRITVEVDFGFLVVWQLGVDDDSQAEFSQENTAQDSPGSPIQQDDDYYFAGDYGGDIGLVEQNEDTLNYDRALTTGDPRNRIHFILTDDQAQPSNLFRLSLDWIGNDSLPIPYTIKWNSNELLSSEVTADVASQTVQLMFTGNDANVFPGENVITFERGGNGGWIQFDYVLLEVVAVSPELILTDLQASTTEGFSFCWNSAVGTSYTIQRRTNITDDWVTIAENYPDGGATESSTCFTDTSATGPHHFYQVAFIPPPPLFAEDFESGAQGWVSGSDGTGATRWELGTPTSGAPGANSGTNAYGTGLGGPYDFFTNIYLRSPVIDLTGVNKAFLTYFSYLDLEDGWDFGRISILDANGNVLRDTLAERTGTISRWVRDRIEIPSDLLGQSIRIEWRIVTDDFQNQEGWFIDDVEISTQ